MKPILLMGHTRALTKVKFNPDGDLLFSVSKDPQPSVWYYENGEKLGTFDGHTGAVWAIDVSHDSKRLLTGSADNSMIMWDVQTGKQLAKWNTKSAVRAVSFQLGSKYALFLTDATMGQISTIHVVKIEQDPKKQPQDILNTIVIQGSKATQACWARLDQNILTGHEDGSISLFDAKTGELLKRVKECSGNITDIQFGVTSDYFIASSKDQTATVFKTEDLSVFRKFETERPVNAAAISPIRPHVSLLIRLCWAVDKMPCL